MIGQWRQRWPLGAASGRRRRESGRQRILCPLPAQPVQRLHGPGSHSHMVTENELPSPRGADGRTPLRASGRGIPGWKLLEREERSSVAPGCDPAVLFSEVQWQRI